MSQLRDHWMKRLDAALHASPEFWWRAQLEARVLRFLLARYGAAEPALPLAKIPVFQGEAPYGRSRALLSERQQRSRLNHIAQSARDRPVEAPPLIDFQWQRRLEEAAECDSQRRQSRVQRRQRFQTRHERGYW